MTSTQWVEYHVGTKRKSYNTLPTSNITAEAVTVDGFTLSQTDNAGVTTTASRSYTASGMILTQTNGRGNTTTTVTDMAGRTLTVTDAAGNVTTTAYDSAHDLPATVTDAQGNTSCYRYDVRGRKVTEWGTGLQPVCFGYDDADRMTSLTTFRCPDAVISIDPSERTDKDVTIWSYHDAAGLEIAKTYADNTSVVKTYDAYKRVLTETDARGKVKAHTYEPARGLLLGTTYSDSTTPRAYAYNHLGQRTQVTDAAGVRTLSYNAYGEQESDSLVADSVTHLITETRDDKGRSTGYTYAKNGSVQQTVTTGYGSDGRIASAGFLHGGAAKQFSYEYMAGTHLLEKLTMPNNMTLTQSYEIQRDLLTGMAYKRGSTLVANRQYSYDSLGRPTARNTSRQGTVKNDTFGYNNRSELTTATVNGSNYAYDYDNIGNRETATESEITTNYTANELNQYTAVGDFTPTFDADGNQTMVKTTTGIWFITYDAENRPVSFSNTVTNTVIECAYDHMGRRATKKVTVAGSITLHQRYLYRGYLQIACCDLTRSNHSALWFITWDPTQSIATRPLAIQRDGTWYSAPARLASQDSRSQVCSRLGVWLLKSHPAYGWDLTKNISELYGSNGYIRTAYTYTPYGEVTESANGVYQPIQWSSEYNDTELGLVYYNYRHYNPMDGRWAGRDSLETPNLYKFGRGIIISEIDILGNLWWCSQIQERKACPKADCEAYKDLVLQTHKQTIAKLKKQRCSLQIVCVPSIKISRNNGTIDEYKGPKAATLYLKINVILIMINYSKFPNMNIAISQKPFDHELVHAFDLCSSKHYSQNCHEAIDYEVRAYNRGGGGCENMTGEARISCVIERTISNLFASDGAANKGKCKNYTKEYVRSYIRKNYLSIIKDMPF